MAEGIAGLLPRQTERKSMNKIATLLRRTAETFARLLLAGALLTACSFAGEDPASSPIEWVRTLDVHGAYVSLEGQNLFLTNDVPAKGKETPPGSWFTLSPDPAPPALVCSSLPAAWQIAIVADHAFVCDYTKFLTVYQLEKSGWKQLAKLPMPGQTENIVIRGKLAYVASHIAGLTIVDISEPSAPAVLSNFNPKIDCDAIALYKNSAVLYGHWESRIVLVDVTDPANPRQTGVYQNTPQSFNQGEMEVYRDFAYCTGVNSFVVVNLTDPAHPVLAKALPFKGATTDVAICDSYAFVAGSDGVHVFDLADPANPVEVGSFKQPSFQLAVAKAKTAGANGDYLIYATTRKGPASVLRFRSPLR
jgi:hypothetical protein